MLFTQIGNVGGDEKAKGMVGSYCTLFLWPVLFETLWAVKSLFKSQF